MAFDVWLVGFSAHVEDPVPELMSLFGIGEDRARKLVRAVPVAVKKNTERDVADKFARRLERVGARVEVRAAGGGESSDTWSEQAPRRSTRAIEPSRSRTGRGIGGRSPSSPEMPAYDSVPPEALPRRRTSSSEALLDAARMHPESSPPPRRTSSPAMEALVSPSPSPRRQSSRPTSASNAAAPPLGDAPARPASLSLDDDLSAFEPRQGRPTPPEPAPPRTPSQRPPESPARLPTPLSSRPPPRPSERPREGVPRSVFPAPLPGGPARSTPPPPPAGGSMPPPPTPDLAPAQPGFAPSSTELAVAGGIAALGVFLVAWRIGVGGSIFQGRASWTFGVWVEAIGLVLVAGGLLRVVALRSGHGDEGITGHHLRIVAAMVPLAALINWATASTAKEPVILAGSLDARLETLGTIADACKRTAKDAASCSTCCEGEMAFTTACECLIPWRCREGDRNASACQACCQAKKGRGAGSDGDYRLIHGQGCVCNPDDTLFE